MKPTQANLECADVILQRNGLLSEAWQGLRRDIALTIDIAEREIRKQLMPKTRKKPAPPQERK